jgi:hypothetical protein
MGSFVTMTLGIEEVKVAEDEIKLSPALSRLETASRGLGARARQKGPF